MLQLKQNCSCSNPTVNPKNWMTGGQSLLKKQWYVQYKFYDPTFKDRYKVGKLVIIKRMNVYKTLQERREATRLILENELELLQHFEYNPITGTQRDSVEDDIVYEISPDTPFIKALELAMARLSVEVETKRDIKSVVKYCGMAALNLRFHRLAVSDVRMKHIKLLLDEVSRLPLIDEKGNETPRKWTNNRFNVYWKYLHRLFEELIELETCEFNPVSKISKKSVIHKMRLTMTKEERHETINVHLKNKYYTFYRFCQIFFHSGGRMTELLKIQVKNVNLEKQTFKTTIKKGFNKREVLGTIKDKALPFWIELLEGAAPDDYIFAKGLKPGPKSITAPQITRRWHDHVKVQLGVQADIYSLKHSNLDETAAILDVKAAQKMAGHTTPVITLQKYLHGQKERDHELYKSVGNDL